MKNILFKTFVIISIFVLFFIVGCGGGGSDGNPVSSQNTNGSINQNFVGNWYIVKDEGREVYSNTKLKVEYFGLYSNGTFRIISYYITEYYTYVKTQDQIEFDLTGTWSYSNGKLNLKTTEGEFGSFYASISNNNLTLSDGSSPADVYEKRDEDYNDYYFSSINNSFVGNWYFSSVDSKSVIPNNFGNRDSLTINSNGTYSKLDYYSTEYDTYIQIQDSIESNVSGYWSYNNGKIFFVDSGGFFTTKARVEGNSLILGTTNSVVYKK